MFWKFLSDIKHFVSQNEILLVLTDRPTLFVKTEINLDRCQSEQQPGFVLCLCARYKLSVSSITVNWSMTSLTIRNR